MEMFDASAGGGAPVGAAGFGRPWATVRPHSSWQILMRGCDDRATRMVLTAVVLVAPAAGVLWIAAHAGAVAAVVAAVALVVVVLLARASERSQRVEWDGQHVTMVSNGRRRVIATAGHGRVVRADLGWTAGGFAAQYWLDDAGTALAQIDERQWDAQQLASIQAQARIPTSDACELTSDELMAYHAATVPKIAGIALAPTLARPRSRRDGAPPSAGVSPKFAIVILALLLGGMVAFRLLGWR